VPPGCANLLFDQIEIIEQPFTGRRNPAVRLDCVCQQGAGFSYSVVGVSVYLQDQLDEKILIEQ
jgi:hypothetical protein